jgi:DNA-binding response OmpR family regulator
MSNQKPKILIVEDEIALSMALEKKLMKSGFEPIIAKNGEEGLALAKSKKPALIILDIIMPRMDGLTMFENLKKDTSGKNIPVILLTNLSDDNCMLKAKEAGIHDYLIKSNWKIEDVIKKIREMLGIK